MHWKTFLWTRSSFHAYLHSVKISILIFSSVPTWTVTLRTRKREHSRAVATPSCNAHATERTWLWPWQCYYYWQVPPMEQRAVFKSSFTVLRMLRFSENLIYVPARNKANFRGFTRWSVEGGFHLKKSLAVYTSVIRNRFIWIIFYSGVGF